jgi:hypothetical protein
MHSMRSALTKCIDDARMNRLLHDTVGDTELLNLYDTTPRKRNEDDNKKRRSKRDAKSRDIPEKKENTVEQNPIIEVSATEEGSAETRRRHIVWLMSKRMGLHILLKRRYAKDLKSLLFQRIQYIRKVLP